MARDGPELANHVPRTRQRTIARRESSSGIESIKTLVNLRRREKAGLTNQIASFTMEFGNMGGLP